MSICSAYNYQGLAAECQAMFRRVKAIEITDKGISNTVAQFPTLAAHKTIVAADGAVTGILIDFSRGYEKTTDEPEVTTSNLGFKEKTFDPPPSLTGYANISMCDYKTFFDADGKEFDVRLYLNDGKWMGTMQSDGTVKGFRATLMVAYDLPPSDNAQQSFKFMIYFQDVEEFKTYHVTDSAFRLSELKDVIPEGIDITLNTAYTAGDVIVNTKKRCTDELFSDFDATTNWVVVETNADDVDVTVVSTTAGVNTLTIKKDSSGTPANLDSGDYAIIQGVDNAGGSYYEYVSNLFKVEA